MQQVVAAGGLPTTGVTDAPGEIAGGLGNQPDVASSRRIGMLVAATAIKTPAANLLEQFFMFSSIQSRREIARPPWL